MRNESHDPDKLFDELDQSIKGARLGSLIFKGHWSVPRSYWERFGARLGSLPCESIQCLGLIDIALEDDAWTEILDRTEILYLTDTGVFDGYSEEGLANLASVKRLRISDSNDLENASLLTGLEEVVMTAGLTPEDREETREKLEQAVSMDSITTTLYESDISVGYFGRFRNLPNLQRILLYPELDGWTPDSKYYVSLLGLQLLLPDVRINPPGKAWEGDEDALVSVTSIDVMERAGENRLAK